MEYDWDTEFLFQATDLVVFVKNSFQIDKLKSAHLLVFYSELVCNTLDIIKDFGVEPYEAINMIPNFFIRLYDYLINTVSQISDLKDEDLDRDQFEGWYALKARDLIDKGFSNE